MNVGVQCAHTGRGGPVAHPRMGVGCLRRGGRALLGQDPQTLLALDSRSPLGAMGSILWRLGL